MFMRNPSLSSHPPASVQAGRAEPKRLISPDVNQGHPVLIVGAGVSGLAAAIALSDIGIESILLDRRSRDELMDGAGINLQPEAIEALNSLGVSTRMLMEVGATITKQSYYFPDGRHVCSLDKSGQDGSPGQIAIPRGELLRLLLDVAASKNNVKLLMRHCVCDVDQKSSSDSISISVKAEKDCTSESSLRFTGSVLLGADGINSNIRKQMTSSQDGNKDPRQYHGTIHYRGVVEDFPSFFDGQTMIVAGGLGVKVVAYPIGKPCNNGLQMVNWVVAIKEDISGSEVSSFNLNHCEHILDILSANEFNLGFDLKAMISKTTNIQAWQMVDLVPLDKWTDGRICLVGGAAHAMLPVGSGGAMAALFDALALRDAFQKSGPVSVCQVLCLYQQMRYKGATMHQQKCRLQPSEHIVQEAMDLIPKSSSVPLEYEDRVRGAMKALHRPLALKASQVAKELEMKRALIIGAGASGLAACKEFSEKGLDTTVFESGGCIGGVFRDAYQRLELTSSSILTAFSDYPPSEEEPTMWSASEYLSYMHQYCVDNDLFQHIQFNSTVVGVKRIRNQVDSGDHTDTIWEVTIYNSSTNRISTMKGGHLVLSVGSNASPNIPSFPGQASFSGTVIHTSQLDGFDMFRGKRVLCLGLGESGSDLPYHIAQERGTEVTIAARGLGWMVPRRRPLKTGSPADVNTNRILWGLPRMFNRPLSFILAFLDARLDSDPVIGRMGLMNLKHPAGMYRTYGTKSINFLAAIEKLGAKLVESSIHSMGPGNRVDFVNGYTEQFDIVLLNTGYKKSNFEGFCFPASKKNCHDKVLFNVFSEASSVRNLFKRVVHPAMKNLYFIGFARPGFGSIPAIAETHARWAASLATRGCQPLPSEEDMLNEIAADKFREETQFGGAAARVSTLVDYLPHVSDVASLLGASPPYLKMLLTDPGLLLKIMFGPASVAQFRLRGFDAKPGVAMSTINSYPPIPMRRVTFIASGLYISSLVILVSSLIVPLTFETRKSLQPVGFPPLRNKPLQVARYILFWIHVLALAQFYSATTHIQDVSPSIVAIIGILEIHGYMERRNRKESLRKLLTSAVEVDAGIASETISCPPKKLCCTTSCKYKAKASSGSKHVPLTVIVIVLAVVAARAQLVLGFQHPNDMRYILKKQQEQKNVQTLLTTAKAGGVIIDELTKTHNFTPLERVALICSGNLQDLFSAYHFQPVDVLVDHFDLAITDDNDDTMASCSPIAVYDRGVGLSISGKTFCNATSTVRVYDTMLSETLSSKQIGIGQLLKVMKLYPHFTLHDAGRNEHGGMWRFYSLNCSGLIEFDILEEFSQDVFLNPDHVGEIRSKKH